MPSAPDIEALKSIAAQAQFWADWSTLVVFIGLLGEIAITFAYTKDKPRSEIILGALCGAIIAFGVYGEYKFGSTAAVARSALQSASDKKVADLNVEAAGARKAAGIAEQKAAEADDRASANEKEAKRLGKIAEEERLARVKIEEAVAWRRLTKSQQSELGSRLKTFAGQLALPQYDSSDMEEYEFALDIASALKQATWRVYEPLGMLMMREGPVPLGTNPPIETGVLIKSTGDQASRSAAYALSHELVARGFDSSVSSEIDRRSIPEVFIILEHRPEGAQGEAKLRKENAKTKDRAF